MTKLYGIYQPSYRDQLRFKLIDQIVVGPIEVVADFGYRYAVVCYFKEAWYHNKLFENYYDAQHNVDAMSEEANLFTIIAIAPLYIKLADGTFFKLPEKPIDYLQEWAEFCAEKGIRYDF